MPTYDYKCNSCNQTWEDVLKMSECHLPVSQPCPKCHVAGNVEKLIVVPVLTTGAGIGNKKPPSSWIDVLDKIQAANPLGNVHRSFSR